MYFWTLLYRFVVNVFFCIVIYDTYNTTFVIGKVALVSTIVCLDIIKAVDNAIAVCKFFLQGYTWYVLEAEKNDDDYEFYGITVGQFTEFGYFTLSQLKNVRGK